MDSGDLGIKSECAARKENALSAVLLFGLPDQAILISLKKELFEKLHKGMISFYKQDHSGQKGY